MMILFTQSQNKIVLHIQAVLVFKANLMVLSCYGNHRQSLPSGKFHYDMRFEKKDIFRDNISLYILQIPDTLYI